VVLAEGHVLHDGDDVPGPAACVRSIAIPVHCAPRLDPVTTQYVRAYGEGDRFPSSR
jgi:hypothetical protein